MNSLKFFNLDRPVRRKISNLLPLCPGSLIFNSLTFDELDDAPSEELRPGHVLLFAERVDRL
jgi:hypothetical protein